MIKYLPYGGVTVLVLDDGCRKPVDLKMCGECGAAVFDDAFREWSPEGEYGGTGTKLHDEFHKKLDKR